MRISELSFLHTAFIGIAFFCGLVPPLAGASPCGYTLTPSTVNIPAAGGAETTAIMTTTGCAWSATAPSWVTITSGSSGTGNGIVTYSVGSNTGPAARTGTLSVGSELHIITQAAPAATCSYVLSPADIHLGPGNGNFYFDMLTDGDCTWAWEGPMIGWFGLNRDFGSGPTTIRLFHLWNTSSQPRTAVITIQGQQLTVVQAGAPCIPSMSTNMSTYVATGGAGNFTVAAPNDCNNWLPTTLDSWITITSGPITNFGSVNFNVAVNSGLARTGSITIGTRTHTVTQLSFSSYVEAFDRSIEGPVISPRHNTDHYYIIKRSPFSDLRNAPAEWEPYHLTTGGAYYRFFPDSFDSAKGFYITEEHSVLQPSDTDDDGINDLSEIENGTNPFLPDSDGDGVPDSDDTSPNELPCERLPVTIVIKTFIPHAYINHPNFISNQIYGDRVFGGDNRSFDLNSSRFRSQHLILASPYEDHSTSGLIAETPQTGKTRLYDRETSVQGDSLRPEALADEIEGHPYMLEEGGGEPQPSGLTVASVRLSSSKIQLTCTGDVDNPLTASPNITYCFIITLEAKEGYVWWTIEGLHDGFPAYEIYVNEKPILQHVAEGTAFNLFGGKIGVLKLDPYDGYAPHENIDPEVPDFIITGSATARESEWNGIFDSNRIVQNLQQEKQIATSSWITQQLAQVESLRYNVGMPPDDNASGCWLDGEIAQTLSFDDGRLQYSIPNHELAHYMRCGINIHEWDTRASFVTWVRGDVGTEFSISGAADGQEVLNGGDGSFGYKLVGKNGSHTFANLSMANSSHTVAYSGTSTNPTIIHEGVVYSKAATVELNGDHQITYSNILACPIVPWHTSAASVDLDLQLIRIPCEVD